MKTTLFNQIINSKDLISKTLHKGEILFYQDDYLTQSFLVKKGKIRLYTQNDKNETMTIFQYGKQEQCPVSMLSILSSKPSIATAEAMEDTEIYVINKSTLETMIFTNEPYKQYVFQEIFAITNMLRTLLEEASFMSIKERLWSFIKRQETDVVNMTHNTISDEIGTNRVVVSRTLKELELEGRLRLQRGKIFINLLTQSA
jgi:CRP/FNR family transcriptional regulator